MSLAELAGALFTRPDWWDGAACRNLDPTGEIFHPRRGEVTARAKAICAGCPVRVECLEYALANVIRVGVWGGTAERWRRRERHQRHREAMGLERLPERGLKSGRRAPRRRAGCAISPEAKQWVRALKASREAAA